ncbi:MAG: DUF4258 domain-containing protein, partial [Gammaproteobacteria bacterium]
PKIIFRLHALQRMAERNISREAIESVLQSGEEIENYPDDFPYPSKLLLGWDGGQPIHLVVAENMESDEWIVITAYIPDQARWEAGFKRRRQR